MFFNCQGNGCVTSFCFGGCGPWGPSWGGLSRVLREGVENLEFRPWGGV